MQHVLVTLQCEEASGYSILIKYNFCNSTFWMPGVVARSPHLFTLLHTMTEMLTNTRYFVMAALISMLGGIAKGL